MKYVFFGGCGIGGHDSAVDVLVRVLNLADLREAYPVVVGDLFVNPEAQITHTQDMLRAVALLREEECSLLVAGLGDTHTPGHVSGPCAFVPEVLVRPGSSIVLDVAGIPAGFDWQVGLREACTERYVVAAVLPRGTSLERVAALAAGGGECLIVVGGQLMPSNLETFDIVVVAPGQLCPTGFDGSGFNAGLAVIYDTEADDGNGTIEYVTIPGPRYHVVRSVAELRSLLDLAKSVAPTCRHHIQLRSQPGDTDTEHALANQLVKLSGLSATLETVPDLAATRAATIETAIAAYRGATHNEAIDSWFEDNPSPPAIRERVEQYLAGKV